MEQEPGKAGEPVPAAPHPDDVPTFAPEMGLEAPLENGSARLEPEPATDPILPSWQEVPTFAAPGEPAHTDGDPSEPVLCGNTGAEETPAPSASLAGDEAPASAPLGPEPVSFLEPEPQPAPAPPLETPEWDLSTSPAEESEVRDAGATEATEAFLEPSNHEAVFTVDVPPVPAVVSAWGPPPPAWPPVGSSAPGAAASAAAPLGALPASDLPLEVLQPAPEEPYIESGPNWMLAFVCLWAAGTALNEAWFKAGEIGLTPALVRNVTVMGYGVLGLGLIGFALDALVSSKKQSPAASILKALVPALLTLAGVILLVLSNDPGRRI